MSTGPIWKDVTDAVKRGEKQGADRERRRIRRAQAKALAAIRFAREKMPFGSVRIDMLQACAELDAATRRSRKRK